MAETANSGYVQKLNNHYQGSGKSTNLIVYDCAQKAGTDTYTATVTLTDKNKSYTGDACTGKMPAKESAAKKAVTALGI